MIHRILSIECFDKRTSAISSLFAKCGRYHPSRFIPQIVFSVFLRLLVNTPLCWSQTASTGALIGEVLDPSGRGIPQATVDVKNQDLSFNRSISSDDEGNFVLALLAPGTYQLVATKSDFSQVQSLSVQISVTETTRASIVMQVAGIKQKIEVHAEVSQLQTDSTALGRVVNDQTIQMLPLATGNFTQIANLSPGVLTGVNNAAELGSGATR